MRFRHPDRPHWRKHGPVYSSSSSYKEWLRDEFSFRCVYCLERERWYPSGQDGFGIDHVKPTGNPAYQDLEFAYRNLVYACNRCNGLKQDHELLDPCADALGRHVRVTEDGTIEGLTLLGKEMIDRLDLDGDGPTQVRQYYLRLIALHQEFPENQKVADLYRFSFGFPLDLPNLASLQPQSNTRPEGVLDCYWQQREDGTLPEVYF